MTMKRVVVPELLDSDGWTQQEIKDSLRDIQMINRHFGGVRTMAALLSKVAEQTQRRSLSWLDLGGAGGDLASATAKSLAKQGMTVEPVVLDCAVTHLGGSYPVVCANALNLPFRDNSFDVVGSCLFLHHLEPEQIIQSVNEGLRVARYAVLINDMQRHPLLLALSYAGAAIFHSHISRHDGPASVRRAYTPEEIKNMLRQSSAGRVELEKFFLFRLGVVVWKQTNRDSE